VAKKRVKTTLMTVLVFAVGREVEINECYCEGRQQEDEVDERREECFAAFITLDTLVSLFDVPSN
jgi:hypothetical protein